MLLGKDGLSQVSNQCGEGGNLEARVRTRYPRAETLPEGPSCLHSNDVLRCLHGVYYLLPLLTAATYLRKRVSVFQKAVVLQEGAGGLKTLPK